MVDFVASQLDLTVMLNQLETGGYAMNEIWLPTLHATDSIGLPGGFTHACLDRGVDGAMVSRLTVWEGQYQNGCGDSHPFRHSICLLGVEDLARRMANSRFLFANKLMPEFDFGAIECWHETIFNRTYLDRGVHRLRPRVYQELPHVWFYTNKLVRWKCSDNSAFRYDTTWRRWRMALWTWTNSTATTF
jgi:hypothetical protein